jgi:hypothetical protein
MSTVNTAEMIDAGRLAAIIAGLTKAGSGTVSLSFRHGEWIVGAEYERESPDSPMVGAASYQVGSTAREAIDRMLTETRWSQP